MGVSFDCASSALLCAEDNSSIMNFDEDENGELGIVDKGEKTLGFEKRLDFYGGSQSLMGLLPLQSEESLSVMVQRECEHLPKRGYAKRLVDGELDRRDAIDWIGKVHAQYSFGPLTFYLSINYLDRFLSIYELPKGKVWMTQLVSVACLSLAAKMEETEVPLVLDLQAGDAKFIFEAKTIQRMELLVLSTLKWRMQAVTPFSFLDYFLKKLSNGDFQIMPLLSRSIELILNLIRGIGLLEFRPSEIAAAVALISLQEIQVVEFDKALTSCIYVEKERVLRCYDVIQEMVGQKRCLPKDPSPSASSVPQSPIGVLDAANLSYGSDDTSTNGSLPNCYNSSPAAKKRKLK